MSNELSEKEAQELFAQAQDAIRAADNSKLNELMTGKQEEQQEEQEQVTEEETQEEEEETTTTEQGTEEQPPSGKTEEGTQEQENTKPKDELEELRARLETIQKENHALRSQAGRIPHVQRKLKELDKKLEELNTRAASPSNRPSAAVNEKVKEALKGIRETDAELADAIANAFATATTSQEDEAINREREQLTSLRQQEYAEYQAAEVDRLLGMYPNAREVFASPSYKQWKSQQTERIQSFANSDSADDISFVFELYAKDMVAQNPDLAKSAAALEAEAQAKEENERKAAKIEQERKRKQESSVVVGSPAAQGKVSLPDDPKALFEKFSSEIRKSISG